VSRVYTNVMYGFSRHDVLYYEFKYYVFSRSPPQLYSAPQFNNVDLWWKMELQHALIESHWGWFQTAPLIFTWPRISIQTKMMSIGFS